jgi:archaemetzincin
MRLWLAVLGLLVACTSSERGQAPNQKVTPPPKPSAAQPAKIPFDELYYPQGDLFEKKRKPKPGEWLDRFPESGQSFLRYQGSKPVRPTKERGTIVLQPLGEFRASERELLETLRVALAIFFQLPVELRASLPLPDKGKRMRSDGGKRWTQQSTEVLLDEVLAPKVPDHAVIYVGVTLTDLYPEPSWNYVFGEASLEKRVGVYSLVRFFPAFWGQEESAQAYDKGLARSVAVLCHETGHAFGMEHCTDYECVMNGSNSLDELDTQFGELCPICLRKLQWNIGFEPVTRYERLRDFYRKEGVSSLASWMDRRLARLRSKD